MTSRTFDNLARAITSMGLVTVVFMLYITGMIACSHSLFLRVFPEWMSFLEKQVAAWTISLAWEFTVLVTISNPKHIDNRIPWFVSIASGLIMLFFVEAFDFNQSALVMAQRWFTGFITAGIGYIYAHLFYSRWAEHVNVQAMPARLEQLERERDQTADKLDEATASLIKAHATINEYRAELKDRDAQIKQLEAFRKSVEKSLECPYCQQPQQSTDALRSHKGHCVKNPKNQ